MKKIALLLFAILLFTGCEIDDDGPGMVQVYVEVVDADIPESFEQGKVYEIDITYLLPDACHTAQGLYATRGGQIGAARRDIYVAGVASRPATEAACTLPDGDLERENTFSIRIDEDEAFTFYLWTGVDENNTNIYTKVIVPVVEASPSTAAE